MIYSMTGFAAQTLDLGHHTVLLELRAVNHRYLDVQFRLPDDLRPQESRLREAISTRLQRGKVECRISLNAQVQASATPQLDLHALANLQTLASAIQQYFPTAKALSTADILRYPGVLISHELDSDALHHAVHTLLQTALEELCASRAREGEKLAEFLLARVTQMENLAQEVAPLLPGFIQAHREKLVTRLQEALTNVNDERIAQEIALYAQKIDVDEELSRLYTHLAEVRRVLSHGGAVGKRLDFLMQELNREANTLGSKAVATQITQTSMSLKVLIEQMREQIQNLE